MEDTRSSRLRARSEAVSPRRQDFQHLSATGTQRRHGSAQEPDDSPARSPGDLPRASTMAVNDRDFRSPRRAATTTSIQPSEHGSGLYRRSTARSRRSVGTSAARRSRPLQTLGQAGPEDTPALRATHENYVHPEYAELNPAYEQPASAKPIWGLAKPLPRVLRPGMIPTEAEISQALQKPERPAENTQSAGIDIDPTDLEQGRVQPTINPSKLSAQLKDSRVQRENNFISAVAQRRGTITSRTDPQPNRSSSQRSATRARAGSAASRRVTIQLEPFPDLEDSDQAFPGRLEGLTPQLSGEGEAQQPLEAIPERQEPKSRRVSEETDTSERTVNATDGPDYYPDLETLKLEAENLPLFEEVHNNHTSWSVFRTQNRESLAELLGVFVQLTIGFCADVSATLNGTSANVNTTAWAWGFATMVGIYISGGISGAHLNPTITIMLWFYRGFPRRKMIPYFLAQFLGAFAAALTAYGVYLASITAHEASSPGHNILNGFVTGQRYSYIDTATAFFNEFLGTAFLACTVLALGDDQNAPPGAGMNALIVGLLITALNFSFAYETGAALNPSRDFGPRLAMLALGYGSELFTNPFWFYGPWAGTLCGAFVGAALYDICIFEGGESPINYPWSRTKRSYTKGKAKWKRRLRLEKREKFQDKTWSAGLEPIEVS